MKKPSPILYPQQARALQRLGQRLKDARLRRRFAAQTVALRAGISRPTLFRLEQGDPAVAFGSYVQVLRVLGLDQDLELLAKDDELGRRLQDEALPQRRRAPRRRGPAPPPKEGGQG
jgi:transcriptional regulator with XRE-family HTH domain